MTDTNQASEDELLAQICKIFNVFPDELEYNLPGGIGTGKANELLALIRTEKLKLLDEVIHQSTVNLKSAKAVAGWAILRKKQLEAEL